jgi:threonine dehydrogenase-like Zn-dependent dehydrogenase
LGDNVAVFGFDDYTASAMMWSKRLSPNKLIVVDALPIRREGALAFGADHVVDPTASDPVAVIRDLMPFGPDVVYVAVDEWLEPSHQNIRYAFESVRLGGTVVITRLYRPDAFQYIDAMNVWSREVTVKTFGSFWCDEMWRGGRDRGDWQLTIDGMARGWIDPHAYVTKVIPFEELKTEKDVDLAFKAQTQERRKVVFAVGSEDPFAREAN